jgi:hypothetical protein
MQTLSRNLHNLGASIAEGIAWCCTCTECSRHHFVQLWSAGMVDGGSLMRIYCCSHLLCLTRLFPTKIYPTWVWCNTDLSLPKVVLAMILFMGLACIR